MELSYRPAAAELPVDNEQWRVIAYAASVGFPTKPACMRGHQFMISCLSARAVACLFSTRIDNPIHLCIAPKFISANLGAACGAPLRQGGHDPFQCVVGCRLRCCGCDVAGCGGRVVALAVRVSDRIYRSCSPAAQRRADDIQDLAGPPRSRWRLGVHRRRRGRAFFQCAELGGFRNAGGAGRGEQRRGRGGRVVLPGRRRLCLLVGAAGPQELASRGSKAPSG